eukprot:3466751-Prymnesium_polylepis.1
MGPVASDPAQSTRWPAGLAAHSAQRPARESAARSHRALRCRRPSPEHNRTVSGGRMEHRCRTSTTSTCDVTPL